VTTQTSQGLNLPGHANEKMKPLNAFDLREEKYVEVIII
jgi:hypothetical protein